MRTNYLSFFIFFSFDFVVFFFFLRQVFDRANASLPERVRRSWDQCIDIVTRERERERERESCLLYTSDAADD